MKGLKTLCLMQLKDKIDMSFLKSKKSTIFKVVLSVLKFILITAFIYFAFYILNYLRLVSLLPGIPQNFLTVIFTIMYLLSLVVCTFGLMRSLYYSKDNFVLLTMPVSRSKVFLSKIIVYYIHELKRNITYILPLFIAYGIINSMPIYFYLWLVFAYFIITAIPVVIGALLSIPLMLITNVIKQYKWLEYSLVTIVIAGIVLALIYLINAIPTNFDLIGTWGTTFWNIQEFITKFNDIFVPFSWIVTAVVGSRYGVSNSLFTLPQILAMLVIIGGIALVGVGTYYIVRPVYFHMASSPFEYKKVKVKKVYKNKKENYFWSAIKKDFILSYRTPEKFYGLVFTVLGLPLSIFLLNKIYSAMDTRLAGTYMAIAFNILLILLIILSSNTNLAHVYSEEGGAGYLLKTNPKPYLKSLLSKLILNAVTVSISLLVTICIFASFVNLNAIQVIMIFIALESIYIAHLLWSAELDIMNPQTAHYQSQGLHINNPNDIKSTIYAFLLSALFTLIVYFLINENQLVVWYKVALIAVLLLVARIYLYVNKVNVYFKERA